MEISCNIRKPMQFLDFVMLQLICMLLYNSYSQSQITSKLQERIYQMYCLTFNTAQWFMVTTFTSSKERKMTKICHQRIITWILILRLGRHMKTIVSKQKGLFINYVTQEQYTIVFLRKLVKQRRTDVKSFRMQFEKMGCGLLREAFRSEGECFFGQKRGEIRKYIHSQISCVCFLLLEVLKCSPPFSRTYTFLFPPSFGQQSTHPHSGKSPPVAHVQFFKLHGK